MNPKGDREKVHRDLHARTLQMGKLRSWIDLNGKQPRRGLHNPTEEQNVLRRSLTNPTDRTGTHPFNLTRESPNNPNGFLPKVPKPLGIGENPNTSHLERGLVEDKRVRYYPRHCPRSNAKTRGKTKVAIRTPKRGVNR